MNRFLMQISWIDAKIVYDTLTSIQNALVYSTEPTEILLLLNEQTFLDEPLEGKPEDMWRYFIDHPFISQCTIKRVTNNDPFLGAANSRIDNLIKDGVTYWGESDCFIPLEFFYIVENFHKQNTIRPYILTFSTRKMWEGWEMIEHKNLKNTNLNMLDKNIPEQSFLRCDGSMSIEQLYEFNEKQGEPEIILLPKPRIEGAMTVLSDKLPENLFCPDIDFYHEDFNLELAMPYYNIPQYHVTNYIKGHYTHSPNKRSNIAYMNQHSPVAQKKKDNCREILSKFINDLYSGKFKKV